MKQAMTENKRRRETECDDDQEEPILVSIPGHNLLDNAHDVIDWDARSLRPFMGKQEELWKREGRKSKPVLQNLRDGHLTKSPANPKLVAKLHDRGAEITLKMFHYKNINVEHRHGKLKLDHQASTAAFQYDYAEP
jgi:hypothetical protein